MKKLVITVMLLCYFATFAGFIWMFGNETVYSAIGICTTVVGIMSTLLSWIVFDPSFGDKDEKDS